MASDDSSYYWAAEHVVSGTPITRLHHHYARLPMILPIAASIALFGTSPMTIIAPTMLASMLCVIAVAALGRRLWGPQVGLLAAAIVAFTPAYRVFSSMAYPDAHACLWLAVSVVLACQAADRNGAGARRLMLFGAGAALATAASTKVFAIAGALPIAWLVLQPGSSVSMGKRCRDVVLLAAGGLTYFLVQGSFYLWFSGDFWFKSNAVALVQHNPLFFPESGFFENSTLRALIARRSTLLFRPEASQLGAVAVLFIPAAFAMLLMDARRRWVALWALAAYGFIAFVPVSFLNGPQPSPIFDGRTLMTTIIPFALCTAAVLWALAERMLRGRVSRAWASAILLLFVVIASLAVAPPRAIADPRSGRSTRALVGLLQSVNDWHEDVPVYVHPSTYIRYHAVVDSRLHDRLRVAVDPATPDWWRSCAVGIVNRVSTLPADGRAWLLASPAQLSGELDASDYGVRLPSVELAPWLGETPLLVAGLSRDGLPIVRGDVTGVHEPLWLLFGPVE